MANLNFNTIIDALLGGLLPSLIWLVFWLSEDRKKPEPKGRLIETFVAGMAMVIVVLPFQKIVNDILGENGLAFFFWAALEEAFIFMAAYFMALRTKDDDEPIDALIYMITAALGFAALENALFIITPLLHHQILYGVAEGDLRFVGSTLLHVVSSGIIGTGMALTYYKPKKTEIRIGLYSFVGAVFFHTAFNLLIVNASTLETFLVFGGVWTAIAVLILIFEKVKAIRVPLSTSASPPDTLRDTMDR